MFEEVPGRQELFMAHIDERVKPALQAEVARRCFVAIETSKELSPEQEAAASLLLGQYTEVRGDTETPGYPLGVTELAERGVNLSCQQLGDVVSIINNTVLDLTGPADMVPSQRRERHAGSVDYSGSDAFGVYLARTHNLPIPSEDEQRELGRKIQAGKAAEQNLSNGTWLDRVGEQAVADEGRQARNDLVTGNLRFAVYKARDYDGRGVPLDDLVQVANEALLNAAGDWDPDHPSGATFLTFASAQIGWSMAKILHDNSLIHVPQRVQKAAWAVRQLQAKQYAETGEHISEQTIYKRQESGLPDWDLILAAHLALKDMVALDINPLQPCPEEYESEDLGVYQYRTTNDVVCEQAEPLDIIKYGLLRKELEKLFSGMKERDVQVLKLRFGWTDDKPKTLKEVGKIVGLSQSRIGQLEPRALEHLRFLAQQSSLRGFLD